MTTALSLDGITKRFGEVTALDNVSLSLKEGEVLGLIGQNGGVRRTRTGLSFPTVAMR